jgi:hypothetical protein
LCYTYQNTIRIWEFQKSSNKEFVVNISGLLKCAIFGPNQQLSPGTFSILHYRRGIVACLYKTSQPFQTAWLIAINVRDGVVLLKHPIDFNVSDKIFVRHTSKYLYYGTHRENDYDGRKRWELHGFDLQTGKYLGINHFLHDLLGSEIGVTVCFEIHKGYFYALSNQTTYEVEEVDWTSFYHCIRFPVATPRKEFVEKTTEDKTMWRRQHAEGPLDDRWTVLRFDVNEQSGDLNVIEVRKEWLRGKSIRQRTCYTTKIIFPTPKFENTEASQSHSSCTLNAPLSMSSSLATTRSSSEHPEIVEDSAWDLDNVSDHLSLMSSATPSTRSLDILALTKDRLALTLTASDKPHYAPAQTRLPKNVHTEPLNPSRPSFVLSRMPAKHYSASANAFIDLVNDLPRSDPTILQRLRLHVCARKLKSPGRDQNELLLAESRDPITGDLMYGLNDEYLDLPVKFWPPTSEECGGPSQELEDLHTLMNPLAYQGNVEGIFDERSLVYATGLCGKPRALVLINFDPAVKLEGLKNWTGPRQVAGLDAKEDCGTTESGGQPMAFDTPPKIFEYSNILSLSSRDIQQEKCSWPGTAQEIFHPTATSASLTNAGRNETCSYGSEGKTTVGIASSANIASELLGNSGKSSSWLTIEDPMYTAIGQGYNFGL